MTKIGMTLFVGQSYPLVQATFVWYVFDMLKVYLYILFELCRIE